MTSENPDVPTSSRSGQDALGTSGVDEQFRRFVAGVEDYAFILYSPDNRITRWNKGAERLTGYTEAEVLGQSGSILFTSEDRAKGDDAGGSRLLSGKGGRKTSVGTLKRTGTRYWGSGVLIRLRDDAGNTVGLAKVMRDLTDPRNAEEALRQSEERFRLFVDNVREYALFQVDQYAIISGWNPGAERLFGYHEAEIIRQPLARLFTREDATEGRPEKELEQTLAEGHTEDERWLVRKDGSRFFARWVTDAMYDEHGNLRGFAKVLHDETARKRVAEERERVQERERALMVEEVHSATVALDRTNEELRALAANL
jgi:PAS domain S-box-containing protein